MKLIESRNAKILEDREVKKSTKTLDINENVRKFASHYNGVYDANSEVNKSKFKSDSKAKQKAALKHNAFENGITLLNPIMDASDRQVLYSNQLLPIEENLRKILKHYDQFGFGNGFELTKPHYQGKFSGVVDLKQIEEEKEGKKEKELNKSKSIIDKLDKMNESYKLRYTDSSNQLRKTRNLNEEFSAAKSSAGKPPLPLRIKTDQSEDEASSSEEDKFDHVWSYILPKSKKNKDSQKISKTRNKILKYSGTEEKCTTFDRLTAIETTDYLNGYYWSLDPVAHSLDSPENDNIINIKTRKSVELDEGSNERPAYISKNGVAVKPLRRSSLNDLKNKNLDDKNRAVDKNAERIKKRNNRNLVKNIGGETTSSQLIKLMEKK